MPFMKPFFPILTLLWFSFKRVFSRGYMVGLRLWNHFSKENEAVLQLAIHHTSCNFLLSTKNFCYRFSAKTFRWCYNGAAGGCQEHKTLGEGTSNWRWHTSRRQQQRSSSRSVIFWQNFPNFLRAERNLPAGSRCHFVGPLLCMQQNWQ